MKFSEKFYIIFKHIIIVILFLNFLLFFPFFSHNLPYKAGVLPQFQYSKVRPYYVDKNYIRNYLFDIFKCDYPIEEVTFWNHNIGGQSNLFTGQIWLDSRLSLEDYTLTLTHEIIHLQYNTANERFCNFQAFIILYESEDDYFHNIALAYAELERKGEVIYEYSCIGYIEEYLRSK